MLGHCERRPWTAPADDTAHKILGIASRSNWSRRFVCEPSCEAGPRTSCPTPSAVKLPEDELFWHGLQGLVRGFVLAGAGTWTTVCGKGSLSQRATVSSNTPVVMLRAA